MSPEWDLPLCRIHGHIRISGNIAVHQLQLRAGCGGFHECQKRPPVSYLPRPLHQNTGKTPAAPQKKNKETQIGDVEEINEHWILAGSCTVIVGVWDFSPTPHTTLNQQD